MTEQERPNRGGDPDRLQAEQAEEEALEAEELDELEAEERPAYDQNEQDELAWCIECGQVCGHAGHRHGSGDHGEIVCEQCGVTLGPDPDQPGAA